MIPWQQAAVQAASRDKDSKFGAVVLIVMGIFFTPFMVGIPILLLGIYRLCK